MSPPNSSGRPADGPLFTGDDYQLIAEAMAREDQRIRLFCELHGVVVDPDDQIPRLRDLAERLSTFIRQHASR